jgi:peptidyl-prolyl cis-trans isomerase SurA
MNSMTKRLLGLALAGLLPLLWPQSGGAEVVDRIVAEVNDEIITMSELQSASKSLEAQVGINASGKDSKDIERNMLEALIDRKLAKAEAKRRGITLEDKEIEAAVINFRKKNHLQDDESFNRAMAKNDLTLKELKQNLADQIIQDRLITIAVGTKTMVSEAEVQRFYDEHYKEGGAQLHLRTMQLPFPAGANDAQKEETKKKAEAIMAEIKNGASFPDVAAKYSVEEKDVGFISLTDLDPRLVEFLGHFKPMEVAPALTPQGVQLIQVVERRSGGARPFEEVAPEIRRILSQKEMEKKFSEWVKTLREKAHIKIML